MLPATTHADELLALYARAGFARVEPPVLQPADAFLDLSGEEMRRTMFITTDPDGRELCLRPDLTLPVCRHFIDDGAGQPRDFAYLGPVFRSDVPSGEVLQAGVESFGRLDREAADAELLALGLETAALWGVIDPLIRLGDAGLFATLLQALDLPPGWRRRLIKDFALSGGIGADLATLKGRPEANGAGAYAGVLSAFAGSDPAAAHALVTDLLSIAGISTVGGRSVSEIAERFLEQAAPGDAEGVSPEKVAVIEAYLAITGNPDAAARGLRTLAADAGLELSGAIDAFESRTNFIAAQGIAVERLNFAAAFGRPLDYYTGMVFELHENGEGHDVLSAPLVAGGRYDGLLARLGAPVPVPAVGFAVWLGRLDAAEARI
ncbi:ATP phosphoribosyltransferase regulatory subunit [Ancylobacter pratisalsi]|uniref:ATP phosphoribosyltransferase regulatory subunit n=1 Tax=Ancylobacter pratisalsi TaxID=1745854 RepID=A0A6P1YM15_9HYPH|nr:ATP phosphoribosyltransferase regulatory subunit [Ancylobacter pratisalsi]QIB34408.1 ATP phosphoribosyltransferase regulatory subunit [Ancylobacter pratisalsi]